MPVKDSDPPVGDLVRRGRLGDPEALALLVRRHLRAAYVIALSVLHHPADAEDVAQEAFAVILARLGDCDPERFSGWFTTIVRNRALRAAQTRRRRSSDALDLDTTSAVEVDPGDRALRAQLLTALEGLSQIQREIVLLHDLDGWTHAEIADAHGISEVNCRQHLFTARRRLRARLGQATDSGDIHHARART